MKKIKKNSKALTAFMIVLMLMILALLGVIIGLLVGKEDAAYVQENTANTETAETEENTPKTGLAYETAHDAEIDFAALQKENPDVFAWLYIPGTDIDCPVLQSEEADNYYESHDEFKNENNKGAVYTELANMKSMCDFNTVLHGKGDEGGSFSELYQFANPEFFQSHETIYLYLDENLLTYNVFAAFERDNTSLIRTYDFTYISGCQKFLDDLYGFRNMGKNIREGWEDVTPYHFLITLTTTSQTNPDKQYVVIAALVGDAAGTIDRLVLE